MGTESVETTEPVPTNDNSESGGNPKSPFEGKRKLIIAVIMVVALAALLACINGIFSGNVAVPEPESSNEETVEQEEEAPTPEEQAEAAAAGVEVCEHDWTITYQTIHHNAVTHTETVEPVYGKETTYHTVCNECGQVIDGTADAHIKETGHSGYSTNVPITNEVLESEGYTYEVTDTPAYDETVADSLVCTLCGQTRPIDASNGQ